MTRKIAILGTGAGAQNVPINDPSWEIWGCARRAGHVIRANRWFEVHRIDGYPPEFAVWWRKVIKDTLSDVPVYMVYPEPGLGNVVDYPLRQIIGRFGSFFLTSSVAYMLALAIDEFAPQGQLAQEGAEIGLWGFNAEYGSEYRQQRAGCRHFLKLAHVLGVKTTVLADSGMAYDPVPYPLWTDDPLQTKLTARLRDAKQQIYIYQQSLEQSRGIKASLHGALAELAMASRGQPSAELQAEGVEGYDPQKRKKQIELQLQQVNGLMQETNKSLTEWNAEAEELGYWMDYLTP